MKVPCFGLYFCRLIIAVLLGVCGCELLGGEPNWEAWCPGRLKASEPVLIVRNPLRQVRVAEPEEAPRGEKNKAFHRQLKNYLDKGVRGVVRMPDKELLLLGGRVFQPGQELAEEAWGVAGEEARPLVRIKSIEAGRVVFLISKTGVEEERECEVWTYVLPSFLAAP